MNLFSRGRTGQRGEEFLTADGTLIRPMNGDGTFVFAAEAGIDFG